MKERTCYCKRKIRKGNKVICFGIENPHLKQMTFTCEQIFKDKTIIVANEEGFSMKLSSKDFELVEKKLCKSCSEKNNELK